MEVDQYFTSYEDLLIHELMLRDGPRNQAYKKAIEQNAEKFKVSAFTIFKISSFIQKF